MISFYEYCQQNVEDFDHMFGRALRKMDRERCPLDYAADYEFWSELEYAAEDYCDEYGFDIDDFDIEEELFKD